MATAPIAARAVPAKKLRLKIEMVPESLWGKNLRHASVLGKRRWTKLRAAELARIGPACAICGSPDNPQGHEVWEYTETKRTSKAKLVRVEIICRMCHFVHHFGMTMRLIPEGRMTVEGVEDVRQHFIRVNECKARDWDRHAAEASEEWRKRNAKRWTVDYGPYAEMVREVQATREGGAQKKRP
jgi:hypothetical protein